MEVNRQFHASAALITPVPTQQETGWGPYPVWMLWRGEKSLFLPEIEPQFPSCLPRRQVSALTDFLDLLFARVQPKNLLNKT
jgi:hypothetical protein